MKYKIGDKVIIKSLRRQGVIKRINDYAQFPYKVQLLDGNMDWYSDLELKPLPEKKEKVKVGDWVEVMGGCAFPHVGQIGKLEESDIDRFKFRVRLEDGVGCYTNKVRKVEKPKEECDCHCHKLNHIETIFCNCKCNHTPSPVKSSEEIKKIYFGINSKGQFIVDEDDGEGRYIENEKFAQLIYKINELVDRLNKL